MRSLIAIPVVIAAVAAAGCALVASLGYQVHVREMLFAATACLVASVGAVIPLVLTRGASQASVAQAGLVGTMIHLFGCTILGGAMLLMKSLKLESAIVYWLLAFYWSTLIALVVCFVSALKASPPATSRQA